MAAERTTTYFFNLQKFMKVIIRQARKEEASQIAKLFMLAWPVDDILESNGLTCEQLHESITLIAANEETIYSYENTIVAEIDGKVVGSDVRL